MDDHPGSSSLYYFPCPPPPRGGQVVEVKCEFCAEVRQLNRDAIREHLDARLAAAVAKPPAAAAAALTEDEVAELAAPAVDPDLAARLVQGDGGAAA